MIRSPPRTTTNPRSLLWKHLEFLDLATDKAALLESLVEHWRLQDMESQFVQCIHSKTDHTEYLHIDIILSYWYHIDNIMSMSMSTFEMHEIPPSIHILCRYAWSPLPVCCTWRHSGGFLKAGSVLAERLGTMLCVSFQWNSDSTARLWSKCVLAARLCYNFGDVWCIYCSKVVSKISSQCTTEQQDHTFNWPSQQSLKCLGGGPFNSLQSKTKSHYFEPDLTSKKTSSSTAEVTPLKRSRQSLR